ncbi:hypothetical protein [Fundidesulfovibrio magnetotacticus]|uniref:hypothetical protein n=1 Tax=Fundidesulfovibrio magnetotacticus TaxID=2730080 RepID=UPI001F3C831A|nr:hypothetical protein [Fundidesulfovibrio magnetotacticus]
MFPGRGGVLSIDSSAVDRIKATARLPKSFRILHGLRHHFAVTLANSGEFTLDMIGELLTHKSTAMTRRYGHFSLTPRREPATRLRDCWPATQGLTRSLPGARRWSRPGEGSNQCPSFAGSMESLSA